MNNSHIQNPKHLNTQNYAPQFYTVLVSHGEHSFVLTIEQLHSHYQKPQYGALLCGAFKLPGIYSSVSLAISESQEYIKRGKLFYDALYSLYNTVISDTKCSFDHSGLIQEIATRTLAKCLSFFDGVLTDREKQMLAECRKYIASS